MKKLFSIFNVSTMKGDRYFIKAGNNHPMYRGSRDCVGVTISQGI